MTKQRLVGIALLLVILMVTSGTAILAQTETETPIPPPSFTDGRINGDILLGGLAIYCVDANNDTDVNTFEDGAITVWGVGDQKYINLSAAQLRGQVEISQPPSEMEVEMTDTAATATTQPMEMMTEEPAEMVEITPDPMGVTPVLLAQATTPNGEIGFFSLGDDQFALQAHDDKGKFFTYTWIGCSSGNLDHTTEPFLPMLEATVEFMMTPEETATP